MYPLGLVWGIVTIIFGIFIMVYPRLLSYTVGIYMIILGLWVVIPRLHERASNACLSTLSGP